MELPPLHNQPSRPISVSSKPADLTPLDSRQKMDRSL
jgi:hypothetical protein